MSDKLQIAITAAKKGAKEALKYYEKNVSSTVKDDTSIVTNGDYASEKVIIEYLNSVDPQTHIIAEESGGGIHKDGFWTIDPIDGTRSFARGVPTWAVLISYCENNDVTIGVCYFPVTNELLYAERGSGSFLNNKKVHVSDVDSLKSSYVGYGSIRHFKDRSWLDPLARECGSIRSPDATYASLLVAKGGFDASFEAYGKIWDIAPFKVIIEEAGGKITRLDGTPWTFEGRGSLMSNGLIHDDILDILNKT